MKKLKLANLAKGLNRNEMKSINGGGCSNWQDCRCVGADGKAYICRSCLPKGAIC
jgi:natural product precursor